MSMIVREMILLDFFETMRQPQEFSDDSGWLGPPRAVPFAWEVAPGTPKHSSPSISSLAAQTSSENIDDIPASSTDIGDIPAAGTDTRDIPTAGNDINCTALVKVDSGREQLAWHDELFESGRHSIHILENAPRSFLASRNSEVSGDLTNTLGFFGEGAVPFKWEMEPGLPRDPGKCREFLQCPLTPPPVLHSKSMVVQSSRKNALSISERMRSLFWVHHQQRSKQQELVLCRSPGGGGLLSRRMKKKVLLLKDSSESSSPKSSPKTRRSSSTKKKQVNVLDNIHSEEEDDLSPVSVLDYNNSVRFNSDPAASNRSSSVSSSIHSYYHTPQDSFSWDNSHVADLSSPNSSSRESFKSPKKSMIVSKEPSIFSYGSSKKNSLSSLLMHMHQKKKYPQNQKQGRNGSLMMLTTSSIRSGSFTTHYSSEEASSEKSSSLSDSSSSCAEQNQDEHNPQAGKEDCYDEAHNVSGSNEEEHSLDQSDEDARSVYYSPAVNLHSPGFTFHSNNGDNKCTGSPKDGKVNGFEIIERVDSLDTIDPGFAPSELGDDDSHQQNLNILHRMTSCAHWQRRQPSTRSKRNRSQAVRSLLGRVVVCCYVPRDD